MRRCRSCPATLNAKRTIGSGVGTEEPLNPQAGALLWDFQDFAEKVVFGRLGYILIL